MATFSLRRLWTMYKRVAVEARTSKRDLIRTQLAFYGGAPGALKVLAYLIERGAYEELHATIRPEARQMEKLQSRPRRPKSH